MSSPLVFDSINSKYYFLLLNDSNNFGAVDYDAHINSKIDYSISLVFISITIQELSTLQQKCEPKRTQLLTIITMSVQSSQLAGYLLPRNLHNFVNV